MNIQDINCWPIFIELILYGQLTLRVPWFAGGPLGSWSPRLSLISLLVNPALVILSIQLWRNLWRAAKNSEKYESQCTYIPSWPGSIDAYVKKADKKGRAMMKKVANKQEKQDSSTRNKNLFSLSLGNNHYILFAYAVKPW